ncbi:hypothetical protein GA0115237_113437 [Streptomyces sp. ScaeMP-6W]|nr:hypothetical protein GA0115237_113437 [Streptomyces sp. ScaeMP-6W]
MGRVGAVAGLEADGVDAPVHAAGARLAGRQAARPAVDADLLDRVARREVHRDRPELGGDGEPGRDVVDHVDLARAPQQRRVRGQQADRPGAEDRHAVARPDPGQLGGVPAGDEGVGEQHEGVLEAVPRLSGQRYAVGVGEGHAQQLRLGTPVRAHPRVAVGGAEAARAHPRTGRRQALGAVRARPAVQVGGEDDSVARADRGDGGAGRLDHTERLVAQHQPRLGTGPPVVHVQVGAAQGAGGDPDQRVRLLLDHGVLDLADGDAALALVDDGAHQLSPAVAPASARPSRDAASGRRSTVHSRPRRRSGRWSTGT